MTALAEKLSAIGGAGRAKEREWRIRARLGWYTKAGSAIRHMLNGERSISADEARQIEAAHLKWCAEKARINAVENESLFREMQSALAAMEQADAEFYRPHVEAVRELLLRFGHPHGPDGVSD